MTLSLRPLALAALFALPGSVRAADEPLPPLGQVGTVTEGLIDTAIAYEIDRVCESLEARRLRGIALLWSLHSEARRLGYSNDQIQAFIDDRVEKDRLEGIARARLADMGAVEGRPETYCEVGRAEIGRASRIGTLLKG